MDEIKQLLSGLSESEAKDLFGQVAQAANPDEIIKLAESQGVSIAKEAAEGIFAKMGEVENPEKMLEGLAENPLVSGLLKNLHF